VRNKIAVIIVTYNAIKWKDKLFESLKIVPNHAIVYCIDNGSVDGTQDFIKKECKSFKFFQSQTNLGFGKANNVGLSYALNDGCTHFLLLNQDAELSWISIFKLLELQVKYPEFAVISPVQMYSEQKVDYLHLKSLMKSSHFYINDLICRNKLRDVYEINATNAAIWLLSKDSLKVIGGFDPLFPHYGEDNDYCKRINYFNFKVGIAPNIFGYHHRSQNFSTHSISKKKIYISYLVRVKSMNDNTFKIYFKILLEILATSFTFQDKQVFVKWVAYFSVLSNLYNVINQRKINKKTTYAFLEYSK